MEMLLALLLQCASAPGSDTSARAPQLSYASETAAEAAPRPRINQGRSARIDWNTIDDSLNAEIRQERRPPARSAPARAAPGRTTMWNGAPVRIIDGQPHGVW